MDRPERYINEDPSAVSNSNDKDELIRLVVKKTEKEDDEIEVINKRVYPSLT